MYRRLLQLVRSRLLGKLTEELDFFRVETLTIPEREGRQRVRIEEPDYWYHTGQDKASSSVPQPDTEADQPVSVVTLCG